ncbi:hypothetical protein JZ751_024458 [Albula glossodonta]|uniref:LisH domain-containing protein n=1 Tax=Albula glossodonta TaxID=121402 RepID=A0A8T2PED2_9TELE|nr:hypothetical protein JZ751_024458 [Albula glossodonta]
MHCGRSRYPVPGRAAPSDHIRLPMKFSSPPLLGIHCSIQFSFGPAYISRHQPPGVSGSPGVLALYVYEYLLHVGAQKSAQTFLSEVHTAGKTHLCCTPNEAAVILGLPWLCSSINTLKSHSSAFHSSSPGSQLLPIHLDCGSIRWEKNITLGEPPGFLHSWWCVFWDLYCAAPDRRETCEHSSEAKAFHDYPWRDSRKLESSAPLDALPLHALHVLSLLSPSYTVAEAAGLGATGRQSWQAVLLALCVSERFTPAALPSRTVQGSAADRARAEAIRSSSPLPFLLPYRLGCLAERYRPTGTARYPLTWETHTTCLLIYHSILSQDILPLPVYSTKGPFSKERRLTGWLGEGLQPHTLPDSCSIIAIGDNGHCQRQNGERWSMGGTEGAVEILNQNQELKMSGGGGGTGRGLGCWSTKSGGLKGGRKIGPAQNTLVVEGFPRVAMFGVKFLHHATLPLIKRHICQPAGLIMHSELFKLIFIESTSVTELLEQLERRLFRRLREEGRGSRREGRGEVGVGEGGGTERQQSRGWECSRRSRRWTEAFQSQPDAQPSSLRASTTPHRACVSTAALTHCILTWINCALQNHSFSTVCSHSAAAAPSPVMGNMPPNDGMPGGPMPPGFFQTQDTRLIFSQGPGLTSDSCSAGEREKEKKGETGKGAHKAGVLASGPDLQFSLVEQRGMACLIILTPKTHCTRPSGESREREQGEGEIDGEKQERWGEGKGEWAGERKTE